MTVRDGVRLGIGLMLVWVPLAGVVWSIPLIADSKRTIHSHSFEVPSVEYREPAGYWILGLSLAALLVVLIATFAPAAQGTPRDEGKR